jgi:signal transduction histidine kinase
MRLASKIFLTSLLVIAVLAGVGAWSLAAVGRLVSVNREITTRTGPALRLAASLRERAQTLGRLEARQAIFRDARYATLWEQSADRLAADLGVLGSLAPSDVERARLADVVAAFDEYRRVAGAEVRRAAGGGSGRTLLVRVDARLDALMDATQARVAAATVEAARLEARTWTGVLIALGAALALAVAGTALLAYRMTGSLASLTTATEAVAAGEFRQPIAAPGADEVGRLARAFNRMAARLREHEETRQEFFATLSHELRSPLTSVREGAHLLGDEVAGPLTDKQRRLVTIIGTSADRLLRLVNQILEISRLRAGALTLERGPVDLERVVGRAVDELRPQAEEAGVTLERERVGSRFALVGDEERLVQVFVNLVANAVRFTPKGGRITVRLADAGPEVEAQVEDTGIGIPAEALPRVFDSYRQAHRQRGGTGLGLAVARGLVEAHGGRITVESREGKGSRFSVLLPRLEAPR